MIKYWKQILSIISIVALIFWGRQHLNRTTISEPVLGAGNGYTYSSIWTIQHGKVSNTDQTNFTVLFNTTDNRFKGVGNGGHVQDGTNGYDIVFSSTSDCGSLLNWEMEYYLGSFGQVIAWVNVPTVSTTLDTNIYVCYGNSSISSFQGGATGTAWDANYKAVYHLANFGGLSATDSTGVNNGSITGATSDASAQVDGGGAFSGTTQYISAADNASLRITGALTVEAWVKPTDYTNFNGIVSKTGAVSTNQPGTWDLYLNQTDGKPQFYRGNAGGGSSGNDFQVFAGTAAPGTGAWHSIAVTMSGSGGSGVNATVTHYLDGSTNGSGTLNFANAAADGGGALKIATRNDLVTMFKGSMDEVRISNIARSADWLTTEYNNLSNPGTFYTLGAEVGAAATPLPFKNETKSGQTIIKGGQTIIK